MASSLRTLLRRALGPLAAVCALAGAALPASARVAQPLAEWKGEYFDKRQGGLYMRMVLRGFQAGPQGSAVTTDVQVRIVNLLAKREYVLSHELSDPTAHPRQIWKLPAGKYAVKAVELVDGAGVKRSYRPKRAKSFTVKRLGLSNLGVWRLAPAGAKGLQVRFAMRPNTYKEAGSKRESSVTAVYDGFTGLVQETFAGRRLEAKAEGPGDFGSQRELRATITFTREISMFFKLDLMRHNHHAKAVAEVLQTYDPSLRACYTNRLEFNDNLRGDVRFTFLLSKETGTMAKLRHTGGTAQDPKLVECIFLALGQMQFPVPESMIGELTYTYDVR